MCDAETLVFSPFFGLWRPVLVLFLTPAVSGAHMWAKWLHNPCHFGGPQRAAQGQNQKWPFDPFRLGGLGRSETCSVGGGTGAVRRKGGGGVGKTGFRAGPGVLCLFWGKLLAPKALGNFLGLPRGIFFCFTRCVYAQNTENFVEKTGENHYSEKHPNALLEPSQSLATSKC